MATERIVNNGQTTVASAYTAGATSLVVTNAALLPTLTGSDQYHLVVYNSSAPSNAEIMLVTAVTGNTLTVTPAAEVIAGVSTSQDHGAGDVVAAILSVDSITNLITQLSLSQAEADALYSALAHTHTFASLTSKPTTVAGYGITDAVVGPAGASDTAVARFNGITGLLLKNSSLTVTDGGQARLTLTDTQTNGTSLLLDLRHATSGTAANGFGSTLQVLGQTDTGALNEQLWITPLWVDAATASRKARITLSAFDTSERECLRLEASGTAAMIGFLGANASARLVSPDAGTALVTFGFASGTPTFAYGNLTGAPTLGTASTLAFDTDGTLAANSDARIATQKAVKTYAQPLDATLTALAGANWAANALPIGSGADTVAQVSFAANTFPARASTGDFVAKTITDFGLSLVDDTDAATARATLGGTTVGQAVFVSANPSAIRFLRANADNTVTWLSDSDFRTAIGAGTSSFSGAFADLSGKPTTLSGYGITDAQPLDATLTAFAALTIAANSLTIGTGADAFSQTTFAANTFPARASTGNLVAKAITDFGLSLVDDADAAAARTTLGVAIPRGYIDGLILSNNAGDANNDIDVAAGQCTDSTNAVILTGTALTKRLDASWAAGTNQGGLDTGSEANSTWYHVWAILKDSDLSVDYLFSTSVSAPTMPAGYTYKRRIGSIYNDSSGNIRAFSQNGDEFLWSTAIQDANAAATSGTAALITLSVPTGVKVIVKYRGNIASTNNAMLFTSPDESDQALGTSHYSAIGATLGIGGAEYQTRTNTSAQIRHRATGADDFNLWTYGWIDLRGKQ